MNTEQLLPQLQKFLIAQLHHLPEDSLILWEQFRPLLLHPSANCAAALSLLVKSQRKAEQPKTARDRYSSVKSNTVINSPSISASFKFHQLLSSANKSERLDSSANCQRDRSTRQKSASSVFELLKRQKISEAKGLTEYMQCPLVDFGDKFALQQLVVVGYFLSVVRESFSAGNPKDYLSELFLDRFSEEGEGKFAQLFGKLFSEKRAGATVLKICRLFLNLCLSDCEFVEALEQLLAQKKSKQRKRGEPILRGLSSVVMRRIEVYKVGEGKVEEQLYEGEQPRIVVIESAGKLHLLYPFESSFQPENCLLQCDLNEVRLQYERRRQRLQPPLTPRVRDNSQSPLPSTRVNRAEACSPKGCSSVRSFAEMGQALRIREAVKQFQSNSQRISGWQGPSPSRKGKGLSGYMQVYMC